MLKLTAESCQERRMSLLARANCDLLIIANPRHILYLTGAYLYQPVLGAWGVNFLLIERHGRATLLMHNFNADAAQGAHVDDVVIWSWYESLNAGGPIFSQALAELEKYLPVNRGVRIGTEPGWDYWAFPNTINLTPILEEMRRAKHLDELALIRECSRAVDAGHQAAREAIRPGVTELDIYHAIYAAIDNEYGEPVQPHIMDYVSGPRTGQIGGIPSRRVLEPGDLMICDVFPLVNGYRADCTATLVAGGQLTPPQQRLEKALHDAIQAGESKLKAGVPASEVYQAVRAVTDQYADLGHFPHHAGHGLGLGHPEAPFLVPQSSEVLIAGDVVTLEPGIYDPAGQGARIEHNYLITAHGFERLSSHSTTFA